MLRNNLTEKKCEIPFIKVNLFEDWKKTMEITFEEGFSLTDLFLVIRSYSDSLIIVPIQMMVLVEDLNESGRSFFTESISIHKITDMSLIDFSVWYNNRWEKDSKYVSNETFKHKILFKFFYKKDEMYPIYPWKEEILKEILSSSNKEKEERIKFLEEKIKDLENKK